MFQFNLLGYLKNSVIWNDYVTLRFNEDVDIPDAEHKEFIKYLEKKYDTRDSEIIYNNIYNYGLCRKEGDTKPVDISIKSFYEYQMWKEKDLIIKNTYEIYHPPSPIF